MRLTTWNCCWKLEDKLAALLTESPDIAIIQECSEVALQNFPEDYSGRFLQGDPKHGLGLIYRAPYSISNIEVAALPCFARLDIAGPVPFRLIAVWNCKQNESYPAQLHRFLGTCDDWFTDDTVLAGDLNSQQGQSFDRGRLNHKGFVDCLSDKGFIDTYATLRRASGVTQPEGTYRHLHSPDNTFHLDYIFAPQRWLPRLTGISVGAPAFWSQYSDHSPVTLIIADK